jgi:hypothetical protein
MKYSYLFLANLLGSLLVSYPTQAQTLKIPNFARPTVTTPQINLPTSRPNITTPKVSAPTLRPQTSVSFPTITTTISVPSFPNVNNLGDRLIQSPQTINFPSQKIPTNANGTTTPTTQFLPASIISPNNLNSTLPLAVIVPQFPNFKPSTAANSVVFLNALLGATSPAPFPNVMPTSNQLQLVPTLITFPKQNPHIALPTFSSLTTLPTITKNLSTDNNTDTTVGVGLRIVEPSPPPPAIQEIISKNSFTLPINFENIGGTLTLD